MPRLSFDFCNKLSPSGIFSGQAFTQSALVDLPLEHATANVKSITLPESYEGIEFFTDVEASMNLRYTYHLMGFLGVPNLTWLCSVPGL